EAAEARERAEQQAKLEKQLREAAEARERAEQQAKLETQPIERRPPKEVVISQNELNQFVRRYIAILNQCNVNAILSLYDNYVDYYKVGMVDLGFIKRDKEQYCIRWPEVLYEIDGLPNISDTNMTGTKIVSFDFNFDMRNSRLGKRS